MIEVLKILFGIGVVWATLAIGVAQFCATTDAWNRTCREAYMPPKLSGSVGYKSLLIFAPVGFFVALFFVARMIWWPKPSPKWAADLLKG